MNVAWNLQGFFQHVFPILNLDKLFKPYATYRTIEGVVMNCKHCENQAIYKCSVCGSFLCAKHLKLRTICSSHTNKTALEYSIENISTETERNKIQTLVERFWGEQEQQSFDRRFLVAALPAYDAVVRGNVAGFVSFTGTDEAIIIVALGVLPEYQNVGIGKGLIKKVEAEAKRLRKKRLLVSTSNDDLPALAFYQSIGFQIFEVKRNVIAEKHGQVLKGIDGLPIRDELRLQKILH